MGGPNNKAKMKNSVAPFHHRLLITPRNRCMAGSGRQYLPLSLWLSPSVDPDVVMLERAVPKDRLWKSVAVRSRGRRTPPVVVAE